MSAAAEKTCSLTASAPQAAASSTSSSARRSEPSWFTPISAMIGGGTPTLIIAEIGVNHDGSLRRALELVELAAACGADAVKLQVFSAAALMHSSSQFAGYQQERVD